MHEIYSNEFQIYDSHEHPMHSMNKTTLVTDSIAVKEHTTACMITNMELPISRFLAHPQCVCCFLLLAQAYYVRCCNKPGKI